MPRRGYFANVALNSYKAVDSQKGGIRMALIYVVEDDKSIQEIESFALTNVGYRVEGFDTGEKFKEALKKELPDLILLDVMLPDEDGLSLVKRLRSDKETVMIPVLMVTAKTTELDKVKGLDLGADDYMTKPFEPEEADDGKEGEQA